MKLRNKKTGIKGEIEFVMRTISRITGEPLLTVRYKDSKGITCYIDYETVAEFNDNWEDYKPAEPLIKDKKIRKAVRAWAEANKLTNICCYQYERTCEFDCENLDLDIYSSMSIIGDDIIDKRHNNNSYTITELCG